MSKDNIKQLLKENNIESDDINAELDEYEKIFSSFEKLSFYKNEFSQSTFGMFGQAAVKHIALNRNLNPFSTTLAGFVGGNAVSLIGREIYAHTEIFDKTSSENEKEIKWTILERCIQAFLMLYQEKSIELKNRDMAHILKSINQALIRETNKADVNALRYTFIRNLYSLIITTALNSDPIVGMSFGIFSLPIHHTAPSASKVISNAAQKNLQERWDQNQNHSDARATSNTESSVRRRRPG